MTRFRVIGAAAVLSIILAGPAMPRHIVAHPGRQAESTYGRLSHRMPAQDFNHFDYGIARPTYHSGWGGRLGTVNILGLSKPGEDELRNRLPGGFSFFNGPLRNSMLASNGRVGQQSAQSFFHFASRLRIKCNSWRRFALVLG